MSNNEVAKLSVREFAPVELYVGGATIPVQYNRTGASCSVLLLDAGALKHPSVGIDAVRDPKGDRLRT